MSFNTIILIADRKVRFDMANTTTDIKTEYLDQMLEDLAGEELSEFNDDFELNADLDKFSDTDVFAEIDSYH
jgi:hypothetical protein